MRYFRLSLLIIVACLLFVTPLALAGCRDGISDEQREYYLQMAEEYEVKAIEQQSSILFEANQEVQDWKLIKDNTTYTSYL